MKTLLISVLISQFGFAQSYQAEFQKHFSNNDTTSQLEILKEWESFSPNDPELYTSYFNYHFSKARQESITISKTESNGESISLRDSSNQIAGYFGSEIYFDKIELEKAFNKIDEGIKLHPNRLDMRFGKVYVLGEISDWANFTSEIIKTIDYSTKNKNNWTWANNTSYDGSKKEFLLDIQTYQLQLYNTGNDDLLVNMREIANKVLEFYPDHVESLSNLSITYLLTEQYDKGIEPLLRAEKINPEDYVVLGNIAQGYKLKGDKKKAIEYYKKAAKYGDERSKQYAREQIKELKK